MKKTLTVAGITLLALPAAAYAQDRHHGRDGRGMDNLMATYDMNDDGQITQEEVDGFRAARLAEFDTDGDGNLNLDAATGPPRGLPSSAPRRLFPSRNGAFPSRR